MPEPVTVEIERLVYQGDGLARLDGQVVLMPFVLPGEQVSVTTSRVNNGLLRGFSPQVLKSASARTIPRCEYFANCGGCHYQHATYAFELEQKREILCETLLRLGGIAYENDIHVISGDPWHYRNRIQLQFDNGNFGFRKAHSHELCAITHCEISSPVLNEVISKLQWATKQPEWPRFLRSLQIFTNEAELQLNVLESMRSVAPRFFRWCETFLPSIVPGALEYRAAGHTFRISRGSFFQVNRFLIDALVEEVGGDKAGVRAVDLYAGVGLFSSALSKRFKAVDAVERGANAYRDLEWYTNRGEANIRAVNRSAEDFVRDLNDPPDLIVADPPSTGLGSDVTAELLRIAAPKLTIVSCDPATLARDLRKLLANYRIERLTLIDLFPRTYHFETVAHLASSI
ncbi:MAG: class I SAM-dependent RNA methyltransferase [Bryobacteraceae bacterium]